MGQQKGKVNGLVERKNKEVEHGIKKQLEGVMNFWKDWLHMIQLGLNNKYLDRIGSTPFNVWT